VSGFYLMHRGWLTHPVFGTRKREPFCRVAAWAWLIDEASFEPKLVRAGGKVIELQRGQLTHSLRFMAEAWGWQHDRCRRFLKELSHHAMIATATATGDATGQMVITICNYDKYQAKGNSRATARATSRAVAVRQQCDSSATDSKEVKEGKEESPPTPQRGRVSAQDEFEDWWKVYPKRTGKAEAQRKYAIARRTADAMTLMVAATRYAELRAGADPQYTARPAVWLHQGRWEDEDIRAPPPNVRDRPNGPPPNPEELWPDLKETRH
jgi:hypothetical protein